MGEPNDERSLYAGLDIVVILEEGGMNKLLRALGSQNLSRCHPVVLYSTRRMGFLEIVYCIKIKRQEVVKGRTSEEEPWRKFQKGIYPDKSESFRTNLKNIFDLVLCTLPVRIVGPPVFR